MQNECLYYSKETFYQSIVGSGQTCLNKSESISTNNIKLLNLLAKYIHKAFELRNQYVNKLCYHLFVY